MGITLDVWLYKWDHRASFSRNVTIYTNDDQAKNFLLGFHFPNTSTRGTLSMWLVLVSSRVYLEQLENENHPATNLNSSLISSSFPLENIYIY